MTILELYVAFGLPLIAIAIGFGALWMVNNDPTRSDRQRDQKPVKPSHAP